MADLSALFTPNSGMHTAFVQVGLKTEHRVSSFEYMARVRKRIGHRNAAIATYFQSGGLVDAVLNQGVPAPIDIQVSGMDMQGGRSNRAGNLRGKFEELAGVSRRLYPAGHGLSRVADEREPRARQRAGADPQEVVDNVITALTSDAMIAPSYWVDPKSGNNYFVTRAVSRKIR